MLIVALWLTRNSSRAKSTNNEFVIAIFAVTGVVLMLGSIVMKKR